MGLRTLLHTAGHWLKGQLLKVDEEIQFDNTINPEMDSSGGSFIQTIKDTDANAYTLKDSGGVDIWKVDTVAQTVTILSPYILGGASGAFLPLAGGTMTGDILIQALKATVGNNQMVLNDTYGAWLITDSALINGSVEFTKSYVWGDSTSVYLYHGSKYGFSAAAKYAEFSHDGISMVGDPQVVISDKQFKVIDDAELLPDTGYFYVLRNLNNNKDANALAGGAVIVNTKNVSALAGLSYMASLGGEDITMNRADAAFANLVAFQNPTETNSIAIKATATPSANRTQSLQDADGDIALTSQLAIQATESLAGKAEIATQVETDAGTDDTRFVTPLKLETRLTNLSGSFATTLSSWTLDAGNVYYADAIHNFGTDDVLVEVYDSVTKETVLVDKIDRTDTNTVRIFIQGNTASLRVVITQSAPVYQGVSGRNVVKNPVTPYVAQNNDIIIWDATSGNKVVDLPIAGSSNNFRIDIKKIDGTANTVTIDPNGAELIDGGSNAILTLQYEAISIVCDGGEWHILASL